MVQAVLLFGAEKWVLSAAMEKRIVGFHTFFLRQVTGNWERRRQDGTWRREGYNSVLKLAGTQDVRTYIQQAPIDVGTMVGPPAHNFKSACRIKVTRAGGGDGTRGGGRQRRIYQLRDMLKYILEYAKERRN